MHEWLHTAIFLSLTTICVHWMHLLWWFQAFFRDTFLLPKEEVGDLPWEGESFCDQCETAAHTKKKEKTKLLCTHQHTDTQLTPVTGLVRKYKYLLVCMPYERNHFPSVCECIPQTFMLRPLITDVYRITQLSGNQPVRAEPADTQHQWESQC